MNLSKKNCVQLSNYTHLEELEVKLSPFFAKNDIGNLGKPLNTKNPLSKTRTYRFSDFFSIGCQQPRLCQSGGLLKETFFKNKKC